MAANIKPMPAGQKPFNQRCAGEGADKSYAHDRDDEQLRRTEEKYQRPHDRNR